MALASSCMAQVTISSTERSCPRCMISAPEDCKIRRMILIAASCPSNNEDAVTMRKGKPDFGVFAFVAMQKSFHLEVVKIAI